jgi:TnpA family transposase
VLARPELPTREVLTPSQREGLLDIPEDISPTEVERYFTFSDEERTRIREKRRPHNRLGFAVQWAYLRYPGRPWESDEVPPDTILSYIAGQVGVPVTELAHYSHTRDTTRREHLQELVTQGPFRPFDAPAQREIAVLLLPAALSTDSGIQLVEALVTLMRSRRIVLPALSALERFVYEVRGRAQTQVMQNLTRSLTAGQKAGLDRLLHADPALSPHQSLLVWLRQASGKTTAVTILRFLERIRYLKGLDLPPEAGRTIHQNRLQSLAREASRLTPQFLSRTSPDRRYALLVAFVFETGARLTDQVLLMHDRMIQQMLRKGEITQTETLTRNGRAINDKVRLLARVGKALLTAREEKTDPFAAIEAVVGWDVFAASVTQAEQLARPESYDALEHVEPHYRIIHRYAPPMLEAFEFKGTEAMRPLLSALDVLRRLGADEIRKVPEDAPTRFVKERWREYVFIDKGIDRRYYELCVLAALRDGLRSGDLFVTGSRQYRDFEEFLLPTAAAQEAVQALPVDSDLDAYLARRREALQQALQRVDRRLAQGELDGVRLEKGRLILSPLTSGVPPEAEEHTQRAYDLLPSLAGTGRRLVQVTDLLIEVDRWTGFLSHFTALKQGTPAKDREALLAAILAEATNLGEVKMAEATPGMTYGRIAQVTDWYIRDETFARALAQIVNAQHQQSLASLWGKGTTSSSDAQRFPVGGRRESVAQANARYGTGPGVSFYTHLSDRYAPFHTKVISAGARDATHVLDGLLYHESDVEIEEHYTDTNGYTEQVFALCHLLGFRFAPRIRDLAGKKLFITGSPDDYPTLAPLIGGTIQEKPVRENWAEVLRLAASVQKGTVTASLILSRLASYPRRNALAWALRELGCLERALFTMEWLENADLRRRVTVGLNKGEQRNALARAVYFYRRGIVQERSFEEMTSRASGLNLVVAAIILWNTVYLQKAVQRLEERNTPIPEHCLPHLSPLLWDHILLTGEYRWRF